MLAGKRAVETDISSDEDSAVHVEVSEPGGEKESVSC